MLSNLCPPDFDGGQEMRALQMSEALRDSGHSVELVTSRFREGFTGDRADQPHVHRVFNYVEKGERGISKLIQFLRVQSEGPPNCKRLSNWLAGQSFDIAYVYGMHRIGLATAAALTDARIPILWHCGDDFLAKQLVHWPKKSLMYRGLLATRFRRSRQMETSLSFRNVAFNSEFLRSRFIELGMKLERTWIIPRAVDFESAGNLERKREAQFVLATRIHEQKGIEVAIRAAASLSSMAPNLRWSLDIVGKAEHPSFLKRMEELVAELHVSERVSFHGQLPRACVLELIRNSIGVIQCSTYEEPMGNTIIEGLGCGTPVIASDVGAAREIVEDGVSGIIVPAGDPDALADAMRRLIEDPEYANRVAREGLEQVALKFNLRRVVSLTESALEEVRAAGPKP